MGRTRHEWQALLAALLVGGCVSDSALGPMPARTPPHVSKHERPLVLAMDAESLLALYKTAFEGGDYRALSELHDPGFTYDTDILCRYQSPCAGEFPWNRTDELRVMSHLLDPHYDGPGPPWLERRFNYWIYSVTVARGGDLEVQAGLEYIGLTAEGGFSSTVLTLLTLREGRDGGYRLRSLYEEYIVSGRPVPACWGSIKCLYWP